MTINIAKNNWSLGNNLCITSSNPWKLICSPIKQNSCIALIQISKVRLQPKINKGNRKCLKPPIKSRNINIRKRISNEINDTAKRRCIENTQGQDLDNNQNNRVIKNNAKEKGEERDLNHRNNFTVKNNSKTAPKTHNTF